LTKKKATQINNLDKDTLARPHESSGMNTLILIPTVGTPASTVREPLDGR
jgi:hypothetical protein